MRGLLRSQRTVALGPGRVGPLLADEARGPTSGAQGRLWDCWQLGLDPAGAPGNVLVFEQRAAARTSEWPEACRRAMDHVEDASGLGKRARK